MTSSAAAEAPPPPSQARAGLPRRRADLVVSGAGEGGRHVVKDPRTRSYFELGPHESFLLLGLDGEQSADALRAAFKGRFNEDLAREDLDDFLQVAEQSGFLEPAAPPPETPDAAVPVPAPARRTRQSILYWRQKVFDPDRLFNWLEPKIRFVWTPAFLALSAALIFAAMAVAWAGRDELVTRLPKVLGWDTLLLAWVTLVVATTCHEFAHGLTCKHFGGEVHEVGFLLIYFTPAFYCNVSDAWLMPQRSRRLWITFAGGYCDLVIWAAAVFVWRATLQDTAVNYVAWVALTICGTRTFFNANPLIKLDGYYLLSDATGVANLHARGWTAVLAWFRHLLWGAPRPSREPRGRLLLAYGLASWAYSLFLLSLMLFGFARYFGARWGLAGFLAATAFAAVILRGLLRGACAGEVRQMVITRRIRAAAWVFAAAALAACLWLVRVDREASGPFEVRPVARAELSALVTGFLADVRVEEGDRVAPGQVVARIDIPDLDTRTRQKATEQVELDAGIDRFRGDIVSARRNLTRCEKMRREKVLSEKEYEDAQDAVRISESELEQAQARLARCREERAYLAELALRTVVCSPSGGVVTTPHLREKSGHYVREGDVVCMVEDPAKMVAEVKLPEQELSHVRPGAAVTFKARTLPFETFHGTVARMAAAAAPGDLQSTVTIYCSMDGAATAGVRPAMTGHARIRCGSAPVGRVFAEKVLRYVRTELWW